MTSPTITPVAAVPITPAPGWTSSEFLATVGVHLLNLLAILLDLLHVDWHKGLSSMQTIIPIAALAISAALQAAYQDHRTQLKIEHVVKAADVRVAQLKQLVEDAAGVGGQLPATMQKIVQALEQLLSGATDEPTTVNVAPAVVVNTGTTNEQTQELPEVDQEPPADPTLVTDPRQG